MSWGIGAKAGVCSVALAEFVLAFIEATFAMSGEPILARFVFGEVGEGLVALARSAPFGGPGHGLVIAAMQTLNQHP